MFRDFARYRSLSVVLAVFFATAASAIADEPVGTSAVPFTVAPPKPQKPASRPQLKRVVAPAQSATWSTYNFPPPNGGLLVFTIRPDGNPACASYDGGGCLWGQSYGQIDFKRLRPLVCGEAHRALFGATGYEDPQHWCNIARSVHSVRR